jgi:DNA-binding NtrC family response regulator
MKTEHVTLIGADPTTVSGVPGAGGDPGALPIFMLRVTQGPDDGVARALDWGESSRVLVGQSAAADFRLTDARVSRRHLALAPEGSLLRVTDLGSTNGTRVNGVRVVEAFLKGGETIEIGESTLKLTHTRATSKGPERAADSFGRVLGRSFEMQRAFALGEKLAASDLPVLIEGESGTGKDLFAEAMHDASAAAKGPYVVLAGGAPHASIESLVHEAVGGTLVIDEPSELRPQLQTQLDTMLDRRMGQVRTITLTKKDLDRETDAGRLGEALFFRLCGARLELPPLRRRHGDIELLATHFYRLAGRDDGLAPEMLASFYDYHWPGNVRELRHAIDRAVALGTERALDHRKPAPPQASPAVQAASASDSMVDDILSMDLGLSQARALMVAQFEERYVEAALARHGGNVTRAAAASGCTRRYFHMLKKKQK